MCLPRQQNTVKTKLNGFLVVCNYWGLKSLILIMCLVSFVFKNAKFQEINLKLACIHIQVTLLVSLLVLNYILSSFPLYLTNTRRLLGDNIVPFRLHTFRCASIIPNSTFDPHQRCHSYQLLANQMRVRWGHSSLIHVLQSINRTWRAKETKANTWK